MKIITMLALLVCMCVCQYDYSDQSNWPEDCKDGKRQSPIDIVLAKVKTCPKGISFRLSAQNTTYTHKLQPSQSLLTSFNLSTISFSKDKKAAKVYKAIQFHFHRGSQHTFDGKNYSLQLHIVHEAVDFNVKKPKLAVYGVLFGVAPGNFSDPFDNWDLNTVNTVQTFPIALTTPTSVFYYKGSLTTPSHPSPCAEIVKWFVNRDVIPIKQSTMDKLAALIYSGSPLGNNRLPQPINGRDVYELGTKCRRSPRQHLLRHFE